MPNLPVPSPIVLMSERRKDVLVLLAKGLTNDEIAKALSISPGTVRSHVASVLSELGVANRTEAAAEYFSWEAQPSQVAAVLARSAIAVLPLVALASDASTTFLAAALSEDLASHFARFCWFPVTATTSSANGRTLGTTIAGIGRALGARFLVDGTLRPSGRGRLRLSLHVDDVETGCRTWSSTQDTTRAEVLSAQSELCEDVVASVYPVLISRCHASLGKPALHECDGWELAHRGMALRATRSVAANAEARRHFEAALVSDPNLTLAQYGIGLVCYDAILNQWGEKARALEQLLEAAHRCVALSPQAAEGYALLGRYEQTSGEWIRAIAPLEAAVARNPSFAVGHAALAQSLLIAGRGEEGLVRMQHAVRLGPQSFITALATLHFIRGEYAASAQIAERAVAANPSYPFAHALAASSAWWLGDVARGRVHLAALRRRHPSFRLDGLGATFGVAFDAVDRLHGGLAALAD